MGSTIPKEIKYNQHYDDVRGDHCLGKDTKTIMDITITHLFKYIENFITKKLKFFRYNVWYFFHISAQNIDCGYSLEPPRRGGSNEYPQSVFWAEIRKIIYTPVNPSFTIQMWGLRGSKLYRYVFVMICPAEFAHRKVNIKIALIINSIYTIKSDKTAGKKQYLEDSEKVSRCLTLLCKPK